MVRIFHITLLAVILIVLAACDKSPKKTLVFSEDFESPTLSSKWKKEGGQWDIEDGMLRSRGARNKDLVLQEALPEYGLIELDMISYSPQVDIKFRAWGDNRHDMHDGAYHFILGGWKNTISTITPLGEHDPRRVERREALKPDTWYHIAVSRMKGKVEMTVNGKPFLSYNDTEPLAYDHYRYFSFANWISDCAFDNLKIYAYK